MESLDNYLKNSSSFAKVINSGGGNPYHDEKGLFTNGPSSAFGGKDYSKRGSVGENEIINSFPKNGSLMAHSAITGNEVSLSMSKKSALATISAMQRMGEIRGEGALSGGKMTSFEKTVARSLDKVYSSLKKAKDDSASTYRKIAEKQLQLLPPIDKIKTMQYSSKEAMQEVKHAYGILNTFKYTQDGKCTMDCYNYDKLDKQSPLFDFYEN